MARMDSLLSIEELVRELDQPNLTDWKLFSQSPDLIVYRRVKQVCCCWRNIHRMDYPYFRKLFLTNVSFIFLTSHRRFPTKLQRISSID